MTAPIVPLRRIFALVNGGTPRPDERYWGGDVPWATPVDLGESPVEIISTRRTLTVEGARCGSATVSRGAILVSTRAPIGYVAIAGCTTAFNQGCRALVPRAEVDIRYFRYQLLGLTEILQSRGLGTTFLELSSDALARTEVSLPSIGTQHRIADFLDAEVDKIDQVAELKKRQQDALGERLYAEVSERLVPGIVTAPAGRPPWTWLPTIESDRPLVRLGYVCRLQNGLTIDGGRDSGDDPVTRPYLRVANVQSGHIDLDSVVEVTVPRVMATRSTLRPGDVLMTEGGDVDKLGRGAVWQGDIPGCLHQNHVFVLRPEIGRLDSEYLALMTKTLHGRCYFESTGSKTTNLASTSSSKILSFPIPLPDVDRQRELVSETNGVVGGISCLTAKLKRQIELLAERKQALITAAVTGQIDVSTASGRGIED